MVLSYSQTAAHTLEAGTRNRDIAWPLRLLSLAGPVLVTGHVSPVPGPVRRRDRSG
jgi:hypothetical protein